MRKKKNLKTNGIFLTLLAWSACTKRRHNGIQSEKKNPFCFSSDLTRLKPMEFKTAKLVLMEKDKERKPKLRGSSKTKSNNRIIIRYEVILRRTLNRKAE